MAIVDVNKPNIVFFEPEKIFDCINPRHEGITSRLSTNNHLTKSYSINKNKTKFLKFVAHIPVLCYDRHLVPLIYAVRRLFYNQKNETFENFILNF